MQPTKIKEEKVNADLNHRVIVDTRSAFMFESFHIQGSVNLNSSDYLVLRDPRKKIYSLDLDVLQVVERLARRGLAPEAEVILLYESSGLINSQKGSVEAKKWQWLLHQLGFKRTSLVGFEEFLAENKNRRFLDPTSKTVDDFSITRKLDDSYVKMLVKKADSCFVSWASHCEN